MNFRMYKYYVISNVICILNNIKLLQELFIAFERFLNNTKLDEIWNLTNMKEEVNYYHSMINRSID